MTSHLDWRAREKSEVTLNSQLENILKERVIRASAETGSSVTLREKPAKMSVKVVGLSTPVTTIRMGGQGKLNHLPALKDGPLKQICDYLLIAQIRGACHAIFIELKKTLGTRGTAEEQLLRSRPLLEYILTVCATEYSQKVARPTMSYVIFYEEIKLDKTSLRPDLSGKIDEIEYKSISIQRFKATEVEFSELVEF